MPFIKGEKRTQLEPGLEFVSSEIQGMDEKDQGPAVSYAILRLLIDVFGGDVNSMIQAVGVIEETKLTYYSMFMLPLEERIVLKRWFDKEGSY